MKTKSDRKKYFTIFEILLWSFSTIVIIAAFCVFDRNNYITLAASLVGVTSLILNAKGNPIGQVLMLAFSVLYGIISYSFAYYGEMITYLGMTAPMSVFALISWLRNPYHGNKAEIKINVLKKKEVIFMLLLSLVVTAGFYFILDYFNTANIIPSTVSVTTSFLAAYLTFRRSEGALFAYALNDIVLIILWVLATIVKIEYASVVICFSVFLINDFYGFINWRKMKKRQSRDDNQPASSKS